jgi:hypothetical protein
MRIGIMQSTVQAPATRLLKRPARRIPAARDERATMPAPHSTFTRTADQFLGELPIVVLPIPVTAAFIIIADIIGVRGR